MKALRLHGVGDLRLHDEPPPIPGDDECLLRVNAVGLCGSDRHWLAEGGIGDAVLGRPLVLGHELVCTVESGRRTGERVVVDPAIPCGSCAMCLASQSHLCPQLRFAGHDSTDGGLRSLVAWPERLVHPLPDAISDVGGTLLEPLGVALHALDLGRTQAGMSAGVFGCGPIGLLLIQALRAAGVNEILATDLLPHRVEAAAAMGATRALQVDEKPTDRAGELLGGGLGVDLAFEAAGEDAAVADAIAAVRPGGRVVLLGIPDSDRTTFTASKARRKGLTLALCRRMKATDLPRAIHLAEAGHIDLEAFVSERYLLSSWQDAFSALSERRGLKVVIEPQRAGKGES
jgi:L-iditol 2-dehydrogenase